MVWQPFGINSLDSWVFFHHILRCQIRSFPHGSHLEFLHQLVDRLSSCYGLMGCWVVKITSQVVFRSSKPSQDVYIINPWHVFVRLLTKNDKRLAPGFV